MENHVFVKIKDEMRTGVILEEILDNNLVKYRVQLDSGEECVVDSSRISKYKVEENYVTDLNGRKENFANTPSKRNAITYYNPRAKKWQTQNYIDLDNIIVAPMVRRNEKTGEFEYALCYKQNPATMKNNQYNGILLEVPIFSIMDVTDLSEEEIENILDEQCMQIYGENYFANRKLQDIQTPVSQSFTNQLATFKVVAVHYDENSNLNWYPISTLPDYINKSKEKPFSSLQTIYALELLNLMYKEDIDKAKAPFEFSIKNINKQENYKTKEISPNKYRFGIEDIIIYGENGEELYDTYATSKDSVQCILTRKNKDGHIQIGLSKQQRSPFISDKNFDEYLYEVSAGMVENGEDFRESAVREAREETGYKINKENLKHLGGPIILSLATQELSDFYLCEIDLNELYGNQELDEQENIEHMQWFDLDKLDLENLHSPLPTKYAILKTIQYYKELELENKKKYEERYIEDDFEK